ncbi:MAG: hypothetical protein ACX94C_10845 [Phycisphaerales bacterium]
MPSSDQYQHPILDGNPLLRSYELDIRHKQTKERIQLIKDAPESIKSLCIKEGRVRDFEFLERFPHLEVMVIYGWYAPCLKSLRHVPDLKVLKLFSPNKLCSLEGIDKLSQLEALELTTAPGSYKAIQIDSFEPLGALQNLDYLTIIEIIPDDGSLVSLSQLLKLKHLFLSNHYSLEQLACLAALRPDLQHQLMPTRVFDQSYGIQCKKCKARSTLLKGLRGTRKHAWACQECNPTRIKSHIDRYEELYGSFIDASDVCTDR